MRLALGDGYVEALRAAHDDVPETADYVMYWWNQAAKLVAAKQARRFGLITTNSITQTFNRRVVEKHLRRGDLSIVFAIPDHPWVDSADGAAVRVAMTTSAEGARGGKLFEVGLESDSGAGEVDVRFLSRQGEIHSDLTVGADTTAVAQLNANQRLAYMGVTPLGEGFRIEPSDLKRLGLDPVQLPSVVRPYRIGKDLVQIERERYIIDFSEWREEEARASFPALFQKVLDEVRPERLANGAKNRDAGEYARRWWQFAKVREGLRTAVQGLDRYIATCRTARHRVFVYLDAAVLPDAKIIAIALADAYFLGVVSSRPHLVWSARVGGFLGVGNDLNYNHSDCFGTFPFPTLSKELLLRLRDLGEQLDSHRKKQQADHPGLTITGMYNVLEKLRRGAALSAKEKVVHEQGLVSVLKQIHDELDAAVFEAYGWPATLSEEEILERLVALNHERAEEEKRGLVRWLRPEFQNPDGAAGGAGAQAELPMAETPKRKGRKATRGVAPAGAGAGGGGAVGVAAGKRAWPKELPAQVAAVRDLLAEAGKLDLAGARAALKGAKDEPLAAALDSLAALGLAVAAGEGAARSWSALR